uniref:Aurora kinase n=1 Tax=Panagrellus redivivus TaxID=6233 RepID=A0A7E4VTG4_PANRE
MELQTVAKSDCLSMLQSGDVKPKKSFTREDFEFGSKLGKGGFGTVYSAREKKNAFNVAIKIIFKAVLVNDRHMMQLKREIELQRNLLHPHILIFYAFFDDYDHVFVVLELCRFGSLFKVLRKSKTFSPHRSAYVVDCVASALQYCHDRHVIHRDIKPDNILLNEKFEPKVADFGWAVRDEDGNRQTLCGTPSYLSPEMLDVSQNHAHTYKVDNWALGVVYYECLTGQKPFWHWNQAVTFRNIKQGLLRPDVKLTKEPMEIIRGLLTVDSNMRSELDAIRNNGYFRAQVAKYNARSNMFGARK